MRRRTRAVCIAFLMAIGIGCYLFVTNPAYFFHRDGYSAVSHVEMVGWEQEGAAFRSLDDSQIHLIGIAGRVDALRLNATWNGPIEPEIFYTTLPWESFSHEKRIPIPYEQDEHGLLFHMDRTVWSVRIDLTDQPGLTISGLEMTKTPEGIAADALEITLVAVGCAFLGVAITTSRAAYRKLWDMFMGLQRFSFLLSVLIKRDLTTKYRRSVLGMLWSVLNPLLMMLVITMVFQKLFRFQVEYFPVYYLTGSLLFTFVTEATTGAMGSVVAGSALIRKVYMPKYIFPLEKCLFAMVNTGFSLVATFVIVFALGIRPSWSMILFPVPILYTLIFSIGLGMVLATLNVFFRDVSHLYSIWTMAWMYLTPVIYPVDILPQAVYALTRLNPMYHFIDMFRKVMMYGTFPTWRENITCALFAVAFLAFGLWVFRKKQDAFIMHI